MCIRLALSTALAQLSYRLTAAYRPMPLNDEPRGPSRGPIGTVAGACLAHW